MILFARLKAAIGNVKQNGKVGKAIATCTGFAFINTAA